MIRQAISTLCLVFAPGMLLADDAAIDQHARALLQQAVDYYRLQGDAALPAFSRQGEFIDADRYVFVVDKTGTLLASGGPSAVLIGRDVSGVLAPELTTAFRAALNSPTDEGVQSAEYRWTNPVNGRSEHKRVYFQAVGDRVIAAGQYLPRATAEQAQRLLDRSVQAIEQDPQRSLQAINNLSAEFREDDLYVFVVDLQTHRYVAHGYNLRLLGVDFTTIRDPAGKPVGAPILALMRNSTEAGYDYRWKNPVTGNIEEKHALVRKVGGYAVAVGYYRRGSK